MKVLCKLILFLRQKHWYYSIRHNMIWKLWPPQGLFTPVIIIYEQKGSHIHNINGKDVMTSPPLLFYYLWSIQVIKKIVVLMIISYWKYTAVQTAIITLFKNIHNHMASCVPLKLISSFYFYSQVESHNAFILIFSYSQSSAYLVSCPLYVLISRNNLSMFKRHFLQTDFFFPAFPQSTRVKHIGNVSGRCPQVQYKPNIPCSITISPVNKFVSVLDVSSDLINPYAGHFTLDDLSPFGHFYDNHMHMG